MDDKGLVMCLGESDVCREGFLLHRLTRRIACPVIVQPGLPHCPDPWLLSQRPNPFQARHEVSAHADGIVRMDRYSGDHRWPELRRLHRPAAAFRITADLHDSGDAYVGGPPDGFLWLEARVRLRGVEVAMRVDHRHWQRIG